MRRIVSDKFAKFQPVNVFYGANGEMMMMDTASLQPVASPMMVETVSSPAPIQTIAEVAPAPIQTVAEVAPTASIVPTLSAENAPAPSQAFAPAPSQTFVPAEAVVVAEALPPYASPANPQGNLQSIIYAEPVVMATPSPTPTQTVTTVTQPTTTTTTAPKPTGMPVMPMGGGGGGMPMASKPSTTSSTKTTTTTQTTPTGVVTKQTVVETKSDDGMSMGAKVGIVALIAVAGFMAYKYRAKLGF